MHALCPCMRHFQGYRTRDYLRWCATKRRWENPSQEGQIPHINPKRMDELDSESSSTSLQHSTPFMVVLRFYPAARHRDERN